MGRIASALRKLEGKRSNPRPTTGAMIDPRHRTGRPGAVAPVESLSQSNQLASDVPKMVTNAEPSATRRRTVTTVTPQPTIPRPTEPNRQRIRPHSAESKPSPPNLLLSPLTEDDGTGETSDTTSITRPILRIHSGDIAPESESAATEVKPSSRAGADTSDSETRQRVSEEQATPDRPTSSKRAHVVVPSPAHAGAELSAQEPNGELHDRDADHLPVREREGVAELSRRPSPPTAPNQHARESEKVAAKSERRIRVDMPTGQESVVGPPVLFRREYEMILSELRDRLQQNVARTLALLGICSDRATARLALDLARALTHQGESRVLLVDGNLSHRSLSQAANKATRSGLSEVFDRETQWRDGLVPLEKGLQLLPAGHGFLTTPNLRKRWHTLIDEWRRSYDWILIDGGNPLGWQVSAMAVAVDGIVIHSNLDARSNVELRNAARTVRQLGGRLVGTVFTGSLWPNASESTLLPIASSDS